MAQCRRPRDDPCTASKDTACRAAIAVMHEAGQRVAAARVDGLLQGVEHEVRAHRGRHPPAHDAPHSDAWVARCSSTIRTARSRTSGENRLGRPIDPILLRNSWVHKFACFEVNETQAESLYAVTEVAERPGAMLGLIGLDSRIGVVDVTS